MDIDDQMVGRILNRREVLALLGSVGATLLIGCSTNDDDDDATTSTATGAAATATTPAMTSVTTETTSATAAATNEAAATATTAEGTATESSTSTATTAAIEPTAVPVCVVAPALTEGPYYVDVDLERSDIRSDPSTGVVVEGTQLQLALRTLQVNGSGCVPLAGAVVDVWHCDALGVYSDSQDPGFDTTGQLFLRGFQVTDENGLCQFTTIYPGWYQGRAVHIHFKIQGDAGSGQSFEFTSQFFFDESITDEVQAEEPYASKGYRTLLNEGDSIYQDGGNQLMLSLSQTDDGWLGTFDIGIQLG